MMGNFSRQGREFLLSALQLPWEYKAQNGQGEQPLLKCHSSCPAGLSKLMNSARKGLK